MAEITDQELQSFRNLKVLHDQLYNDPKIGLSFKRLIKDKFPTVAIPELDAAAPHVERMDKIEQSLNEIKGMFGSARDTWQVDQDASRLKAKYDLTDEAMDKVRELATKDKVPLEYAAKSLIMDTPEPVKPSGITAQRWNFFGKSGQKEQDDDLARLINDPDGWLDDALTSSIKNLPVGV